MAKEVVIYSFSCIPKSNDKEELQELLGLRCFVTKSCQTLLLPMTPFFFDLPFYYGHFQTYMTQKQRGEGKSNCGHHITVSVFSF